MKLRYVILGVSTFLWSALVVAVITFIMLTMKIEYTLETPLLYFVILGAGILIGYGVGRGKA